MITVSIDVNKVDKNKLKDGNKGAKYLDLVLFENRDGEDRFGNHGFVCQSLTKEERANGVRGAIIGNYKNWQGASQQAGSPQQSFKPKPKPAQQDACEAGGDEVPF